MRLTIIKSDAAVIVNGERHTVDCSALPVDFHALQWDGTGGEVEYGTTRCGHCGARSKKGNAIIWDVAPYQSYIDAWQTAKLAADEAKAKLNAAGPQS